MPANRTTPLRLVHVDARDLAGDDNTRGLHRVDSRCPHCGMNNTRTGGHHSPPAAGDITICYFCAGPSWVTATGERRALDMDTARNWLTTDELYELAKQVKRARLRVVERS